VFKRLAAARASLVRRNPPPPDLESQREELRVEVWHQEAFERRHPFTCAVIRQTSAPGSSFALSKVREHSRHDDRARTGAAPASGDGAGFTRPYAAMRHDLSRWIQGVFRDSVLVETIRAIEEGVAATGANSTSIATNY
jgi:hypothetical protein